MGSVGASQVHRVFVYGSLMEDEVVSAILKRIPSAYPAFLHHHHRYSIKGRIYPGIRPAENRTVLGKVLLGITDSELSILDTFEDFEYERRLVDIETLDSGEKLNAYTYVWAKENDPDLHGDWNFNDWKQAHMEEFLEITKHFMVEMEKPEHNTRVELYKSYYEKYQS